MKTALLIGFLILNLALAVQAKGAPKWSMKYLARASNVILVANDQALNKEPIVCKLKRSEPEKLSLNLRKVIDRKIKSLTPDQKEQIYKDAMNCKVDCTCDIYALAMENEKDPKVQKILELANVQGKNTPPEYRVTCAQNFKEFCSSSLLKSLR